MDGFTTPEDYCENAAMSAKQRVAVTVVILVALSLFVVAYWLRSEDTSDLAVTSNSALEAIIPQREAEVLRQDQVAIDLAPGYTGRLSINGVAIPVGDTTVTEALNLIVFRPGPDKVFEALEDGRNCVTATYWRTEVGPERSEDVQWCFEVT